MCSKTWLEGVLVVRAVRVLYRLEPGRARIRNINLISVVTEITAAPPSRRSISPPPQCCCHLEQQRRHHPFMIPVHKTAHENSGDNCRPNERCEQHQPHG